MNDSLSPINKLRRNLLTWGNENIQKYPWRWCNDPYLVLVAEFMLHRTQVKQVIPIYERFIQNYPALEDYVKADKGEVTAILSSLGLQWRITGMMKALDSLWILYQDVPPIPTQLMAVEGIGQYIAGATYCFTQNKPIALIDTNTVRVIGRIFGFDLSGEARRRKTVIQAINDACDSEQPRDYYYALIDLAHSICTPRNPQCFRCPLLEVPCHFGKQFTSLNENEAANG